MTVAISDRPCLSSCWLLIPLTLPCMSTVILWSVHSSSLFSRVHTFIHKKVIDPCSRNTWRQACHVMISDSFIFEVSPLKIILCMIVFFLVRLQFAQIKASRAPGQNLLFFVTHTHTHTYTYTYAFSLPTYMHSTHHSCPCVSLSIHFHTGLVRMSNDIDLFSDGHHCPMTSFATHVRYQSVLGEKDAEVIDKTKSSAYDIIIDWLRLDKKEQMNVITLRYSMPRRKIARWMDKDPTSERSQLVIVDRLKTMIRLHKRSYYLINIVVVAFFPVIHLSRIDRSGFFISRDLIVRLFVVSSMSRQTARSNFLICVEWNESI